MTLTAFSNWLAPPPSLLLCFLWLKLRRVSGASSSVPPPPPQETAIRPTNLPASSSSSSSSSVCPGRTRVSLPLWFFLLLFLPLHSPSSSPLLLQLCSDWLKLEERGGVGESSLSEDEEEVGTCGRWAGLQEEAVAPTGPDTPPPPPLCLLLFFLLLLLSRESRRRPREARAPRRRRRTSNR